MTEARSFRVMVPITDTLADDHEALAEYEDHVVDHEWAAQIRRAGGEPTADRPRLERRDNRAYGSVITDEDGNPLTDSSGFPMIDHIKLFLVMTGQAIPPPAPWPRVAIASPPPVEPGG
jgi:hypothetical protein